MKIYTIGEFAKLCNVTVKTLRHYEKLNLVFPNYNPDNGYRRYSDLHVVQVETVMALKLLGFSLNEIAALFKDNKQKLTLDLSIQKSALTKKLNEIAHIIDLIEVVETRQKVGEGDLSNWIELIKEMKMQSKNLEWYLSQSEEDMRKLSQFQPNKQEAVQLKQQWDDLIARAKQQMSNFDQIMFDEIADEWIALTSRFISDKRSIAGLFSGYATMATWPKDRQLFEPTIGEFVSPKLLERLNA